MWLIEQFRHTPALAVFLTIGLGFLIGKIKIKGFSLGTVTSVLVVGVIVGQTDVNVGGPLKTFSFMLFLFCIGYSVGPQFFKSLKGEGLKQVFFAVIMCLMILGVSIVVSMWLGLDPGQAAGMMAGSSTSSPVVGAAEDAVSALPGAPDKIKAMVDSLAVCYAMTYVIGTLGAVWLLGYVGPWMMGGLEKVKAMTREYEATHDSSPMKDDPALFDASRPVAYRAYRVEGDWADVPRTAAELEGKLASEGARLAVERVRTAGGKVVDAVADTPIVKGDTVVLSGRREQMVTPRPWLGPEVAGVGLLTFPVEQLDITIGKAAAGMPVAELVEQPWMNGVQVRRLRRDGTFVMPVSQAVLRKGDILEVVGRKRDVEKAGPQIGFVDKPTVATDFVFIGIGVLLGGLLGCLALKFGNVTISLGTSGGALVMGLVLGWLRAKRPTYGAIPKASLWVFNNLGLNLYIAVVGISSGPAFISSFQAVGPKIFLGGLIVTVVPLLIALWLSYKVFKFHPAVALGCCAGARKTTAGLGAVQERLGSSVPAMGYTVTYAVSNTFLIIMGIILVMVMA